MTKVVGFKLTSGLEMIGQVTGENDEFVFLDKAVYLQITQNQEGQPAIRFLPPSILVKGQGPASVELRKHSISLTYELEPDYEKGYLSHTSGIILPS